LLLVHYAQNRDVPTVLNLLFFRGRAREIEK